MKVPSVPLEAWRSLYESALHFKELRPWKLPAVSAVVEGYGLCLWRMGRFREAEDVIDRILRLNPPDNQCVRFLLPDIRAGKAWEENRGDR